jgi:uncharacterized protein
MHRQRPVQPRTLPRLLTFAFAAILASGLAMTASAQTPPTIAQDGTLLSISAEAKVTRTPDIATLSTGVVTQAAEANAALRQNTEQMTRVVAAIKAAGIAERDVQTTGISINPQYRYAENQPPTITGYQANNTLNVKVRDIAKLGKVLDALVAAIKKAQSRAELYAKTLGLRVRRVVSINEGGGYAPPTPMPVMMRATAMEASDTPVSPGETALSASINVVFELGR